MRPPCLPADTEQARTSVVRAGKYFSHAGVSMTEVRQEHLTTTEARAGATPHVTRVVLGVGLLLAIAVFALILFIAR